MTRAGFPYVRPDSKLIRADEWLLLDGTAFRGAPGYLADWDYHTALTFRRELHIDVGAIKADCGLGANAKLGLTVSAFSTMSWVRAEAFRQTLDRDDGHTVVQFQVPGEELGGNLRLRTAVVLQQSDLVAPATARIPGSVMWDDTFEIRLQGDAPLFPISVVDFERAGFPAGAGWYLDLRSELGAPLHSSIRLYVNASSANVVAAFQNAGSPRPEDHAILRAVRADVARLMVEHALNLEAASGEQQWDPESLGFALSNVLHRFFGGEDLEQVNLRRISHPADFSVELFSQMHVFDGE